MRGKESSGRLSKAIGIEVGRDTGGFVVGVYCTENISYQIKIDGWELDISQLMSSIPQISFLVGEISEQSPFVDAGLVQVVCTTKGL